MKTKVFNSRLIELPELSTGRVVTRRGLRAGLALTHGHSGVPATQSRSRQNANFHNEKTETIMIDIVYI